ncbi:MAG TPA: rod shape-determining protein RodA [Salinimicrobium sp.]|nr:rod shape-determining protein RodA [Salinimicrobium sp.]
MAKTISDFDWLTIFLFLILVVFGWMNIYSASLGEESTSLLDFDQVYGKQLVWIILSVFLIIIILSIEAKFYERFASIFFIISLVSLLGLFVFGKTISGATSWYSFGGVGIQPSEFAKAATALALAKYVSDIQTNVKMVSHQLKAFLIVALPALIILPQPDAGSALVYMAFFFPLYREGLSAVYFLIAIAALVLFIMTLLMGPLWSSIVVAFITAFVLFLKKKKKRGYYIRYLGLAFIMMLFCFSVSYIFENVFEQRHRDRFNILLGREVDPQGIGYNTNQSEIAVGSGGWFGKGWTEGTQTKGGFVPEQHTDYIFSTIGEEWGFVGSTVIIILYVLLLLRLIFLAERQRSQFKRVYGYSVVSILFIHFLINIGMVIGIVPTIGIPLPFFSYGGSSLWGFTILLFVFIKLDSERSSFF